MRAETNQTKLEAFMAALAVVCVAKVASI